MHPLGGWLPTSRTGVTPPTVQGPKPSTGTLTITHWSILTQPESLALVREITSESGTWDTVQSMDSGASARRIMTLRWQSRATPPHLEWARRRGTAYRFPLERSA